MTKKTYVGVDIGGTSIVAGLMVDRKIEKTCNIPTMGIQPLDIILKQLFNAIDEVINKDVAGIGVGCPGFIDADAGKIVNINNIPAFKGINLKKLISDKYNLPVFINNDANCFVLGETYFGAAKAYKHVLGITLGTGLGGGVVINKKVYAGLHGAAGEIGCIPFRNGIIEDFCSSKFFSDNYSATGYELYNRAETGDPDALTAFAEMGRNLGWLLNNVMYVLAPEIIVIGGSIAGAFKYIEPGIKAELSKFLFEDIRNNIVIKPAEIENAGLMGAAALCMSELE
ncbi:MAG: ROK family protein [Salinivirgaceae bacterium]|jgi:glucokinase|nr:ROK family protein [Salinivirgaceae bacterium]